MFLFDTAALCAARLPQSSFHLMKLHFVCISFFVFHLCLVNSCTSFPIWTFLS